MRVYKRHDDDGLVILAMHREGGANPKTSSCEHFSVAGIAQVPYVKKWPYPVYNKGTVNNYEMGGNPQIFIFDHSGKMVYDPKYGIDYERKVAKYASQAPDWLLGDREFEELSADARKVERRRDLGGLLTELSEKAQSGEGKEKEEAAYLVERIEWYAKWMNQRAEQKFADGFPSEAEEIYDDLEDQFRGHEIGEKAKEMVEKFRNDEAYRKELDAEKAIRRFERPYYRIKPKKEGDDPDRWERRYGRYIRQVKDQLERIGKDHSGTQVYERLKKLAARIGVS